MVSRAGAHSSYWTVTETKARGVAVERQPIIAQQITGCLARCLPPLSICRNSYDIPSGGSYPVVVPSLRVELWDSKFPELMHAGQVVLLDIKSCSVWPFIKCWQFGPT
jgi:hypothetical protein